MKYLRTFNHRLGELRRKKKLTQLDIATFCRVDEATVADWESLFETRRSFPTLDQLLDLSIKTGESLETFLDLELFNEDGPQLDLLSFADHGRGDLTQVLNELGDTINSVLPTDHEQILLRRFRLCDDEKREFIMQLLPADSIHGR